MEETFAGLVAEVERVIRPLGFRIENAERGEKSVLISGNSRVTRDDGELSITIIRKGRLG